MKKFLIRIALFLLPIVLGAICLEFMLRTIPNSFNIKVEKLQQQSETVETLVLGNSHSLYGVNPEFFDTPAFNLSQVSQSPDLDLAVLKHFISWMPNLKTLVVRISYDSTFEQLGAQDENWRLKDYNLYYNMSLDNKLSHRFEVLAVSLKHNIKRLKAYYVDNELEFEMNDLGWESRPQDGLPENIEDTGVMAAKRHTATTDVYFNKNIEVYEDLLQFCNDKGIDVIAVTLPAHASYYENLDLVQLQKTIKLGELLEKEYSNFKYYNFLKDPAFQESDFFDADHLNAQGAKKISLKINRLIKD